MDRILRATNDFILKFTGCAQDIVFRGYQNRAALPKEQNFVVYNVGKIRRVGTNIAGYDKAEQNILQNIAAKEYTIDIDFCSASETLARSRAEAVEVLSRSPVAVLFFDKLNIGLLYADDIQALPYVDDSKQYIHRYRISIHLYALTIIETEQDYFDKAEIGKSSGRQPYFENIDVEHPPANKIEEVN